MYGCGLRCFELRNIHLSDIDFERSTIHIRAGKGIRDRYVPLSGYLIPEIQQYIKNRRPKIWLFSETNVSKKYDFTRYSKRGIHWMVRKACKKAEIDKAVNVHTLRHTFATHLLEDGLDIVSIKELLGHMNIATTMVYLHIARTSKGIGFSPLDTLFGLREAEFKQGSARFS